MSVSDPSAGGDTGVYSACVSFVKKYAGLNAVHQGWQNRSSLPSESNSYAVVSLLASTPLMTPVERFLPDTDAWEVSRANEISVQIDICGENDGARIMAQNLHLMASSSVGIEFFNARGLSVLYADEVRDLTFVGDAQQFVRRYMITLHLSAWSAHAVDCEGFERANITRIENVDAHHPPV